jgi:4'-phosphopantetheinyl transferase
MKDEASLWPAAEPRALPGDSLHVWRVGLDVKPPILERLAATLSEAEMARGAAFRQARDQRRFVAGRGALRMLLAHYLDVRPQALRFVRGAHGKPALAGEAARGLHFNVAHAHEMALIAVRAGVEVGVDVEYGRPLREADAIAARFFSPGEAAELAALPAEAQLAGFYACWTRKEAYIKLTGKGLAEPLDGFQVSLDPIVARVIWVRDGDAGAVSLHALTLPAPYTGAVATWGAMPRVVCVRWGDEEW